MEKIDDPMHPPHTAGCPTSLSKTGRVARATRSITIRFRVRSNSLFQNSVRIVSPRERCPEKILLSAHVGTQPFGRMADPAQTFSQHRRSRAVDDFGRVVVRERFLGRRPFAEPGQDAALFELSRVRSVRLERRPADVGFQLLLGIKRGDEPVRRVALSGIKIMHAASQESFRESKSERVPGSRFHRNEFRRGSEGQNSQTVSR
jgi:hypothetical protein